MKKTLSLLLTLALLCGGLCVALAETYDLGAGLELISGAYSCTPADDGTGAVIISGPGGLMYTVVIDASGYGVTEDQLAEMMLSRGTHELAWGTVSVEDDARVAGETRWVKGTSVMEGESFDIAVGVNGQAVLMGMSMGLTEADLGDIMAAVHNTGSAPAAQETREAVAADAGTLVGLYDVQAPYGIDEYINLIFTPDGHGRLINGTSAPTFDYAIEDGAVNIDADELQAQVNADGTVTLSVSGVSFDFVKRQVSPEDAAPVVGDWHLSALAQGGVRMDGALLSAAGLSIDMTVCDAGAIDWHAVTDSDSTVAQAWSVKDGEYFFKNGPDLSPMTVEGDRLTITMSNGDEDVVFEFTR